MPRVVWLLVVGRAVNRLGAFTLPFLALLLTQERGWSTAAAGLTMSGFGLATIPSRLMGGRMAERLGRRTTIVVGLVGCASAQLALAALSSPRDVVVSVLALGLCFEIYEPASQALVADSVVPDLQLRAHGLMAAALAGAGALAGGLAAVLSSIDLRWLFVADAASCLLAALFLGVALPGPDLTARAVQRRRVAASSSGAVGSPWRDVRLLRLLAVQTAFAVVYLQSTVALPLTVSDRGLGPQVVGVMLAASALTMIAAQPLLGSARTRTWSPHTRLGVGFMVMAAGLTGYAVATSPTALVVCAMVVALGDLVLIGQLMTLGSNLAPPGLRARYLAVFGTSWGYASVLAPLVGTVLLDRTGVPGTWLAMATACLALAFVTRWSLPDPTPDPTPGPMPDPKRAGREGRAGPRVAACAVSPPPKPLTEPLPSPSRPTTSRST